MPKRLFNLTVSLLLSLWDWIHDHLLFLLGRKAPARGVVLAYHSVLPKERELFAQQMDKLLQKATPVRADAALLPTNTGRFVAVTFDDGLESILENALPELRKRSIPATLFIVTDMLGRGRDWEHLGGEDTRAEMVMTREQLCALPLDLIDIGSHSMSHPLLPKVSPEKMREEMLGSKLKLEQMLNRKVKLFSFPYGGFNQAVIDECKSAGYERAFTALPVFAYSTPGEFETGRVSTHPTDWPLEYRMKLLGAYRWLPHAFQMKKRIKSLLKGKNFDARNASKRQERAA